MKNKPVQVSLVGKTGKEYQIQLPKLEIPITVNENLYRKMRSSTDYHFINQSVRKIGEFSES